MTMHTPIEPSEPAPGEPSTFAQNMARLSAILARTLAIRAKYAEADATAAWGEDLKDTVRAFEPIARYWMSDPLRSLKAQQRLMASLIDLTAATLSLMHGQYEAKERPNTAPQRGSNAAEWLEHPIFDYFQRAHALLASWAEWLVEEAEAIEPAERELARFHLRQFTAALSPANFVLTNPAVLQQTMEEAGANLVRGAQMLIEDLEAGRGTLKIRQSDASKFELGRNIATTPGKVVYRSELIELIQYGPTTDTVLKTPLLLAPSWINKFYILDLAPEKSLIKWLVAQGLTVFVISWVNPDARLSAMSFDDYLEEGLIAALRAIEELTGERQVHVAGYCVGGTLASAGAAYLAGAGEERIASLTLLAAQVDFELAGELKALFDESKVRLLEDRMYARGFLEGVEMASAFNMLRPQDLIWSYVVNVYLKGAQPPAFDLLYWNSDSTRIPAANHAYYLRSCYLENRLAKGAMELLGERLDLGRVKCPVYCLAAREDHIAPARSVFRGAQCFGGPVTFVLAGSGHIAGVVNPPAKLKYQYWTGGAPAGELDQWLKGAASEPGSWWPHWVAWLEALDGTRIEARTLDALGERALGDAPGTFVTVRA